MRLNVIYYLQIDFDLSSSLDISGLLEFLLGVNNGLKLFGFLALEIVFNGLMLDKSGENERFLTSGASFSKNFNPFFAK